MSALLSSRSAVIWLLLVLATVASWAFGHGLGIHDVQTAGIAIIAVSMLKFRLILFEFMELRGAPTPMRVVGEVWSLGLGAVLIALFLST